MAAFFVVNAMLAELVGVKIFALEDTLGLNAFNWNLAPSPPQAPASRHQVVHCIPDPRFRIRPPSPECRAEVRVRPRLGFRYAVNLR